MSETETSASATATANRSHHSKTALLGWALPAMEAMAEQDREFVVVGPEAFQSYADEHGIEFVGWDFDRRNEHSNELVGKLREKGVTLTVPLYEECVTWSGSLNAQLRQNPRLFNRALLFRDKAMMKRKAQLSGIRVGVFEEADGHEDVERFFKRVNTALLKLDGETEDPVHLKPLSAAGSVGHRMIRTKEDIAKLDDSNFPCLLESHLDGQEFSCEVFIHNRKIRFLNITEYVHLGYSNFVPCSPKLESQRARIREEIEKLIDAFEIDYGMIHPEYFITSDGKLNFGEVAARVPGGHIFDLIQRAYGFNPFYGLVLCSDPNSTEEELADFFPAEDEFEGYAASLMVYPRKKRIEKLSVPEELENHPFFERHDLFEPMAAKVPDREGFGNHYGTVFLCGDNPDTMRQLLLHYEDVDFYV